MSFILSYLENLPSNRRWNAFLGAVALIDCICTITCVTSSKEIIEQEEIFSFSPKHHVVNAIIGWSNFVRNAFNLVWFCQAWIVAWERAISILRGDELIIIMSREEIREEEEATPGHHTPPKPSKMKAAIGFPSKTRAIIAFFETLLFHLSLLPMFNSSHSYMFTALLFIQNHFSFLLSTNIQNIKSVAKKEAISRFLRRPRLFYSRVRSILVLIRWSKFFLPLILKVNKLLRNMQDSMKKWKQYKSRKRAKRLYHIVKTVQTREKAARKIQSDFRAMRARQHYATILKARLQKEKSAAIRMQNRFRSSIAQSKLRWMKKQRELDRLKRQKISVMTNEERTRLMELQKETNFHLHKRKENALLIRPNRKFSVIWKFLRVSCVILEIMQVVLAPMLTGNTEKMSLGEMLALILHQSVSYCSQNDGSIRKQEQNDTLLLQQQCPAFQMIHAATVTLVAMPLHESAPVSVANNDEMSSLLHNTIMIFIPILVNIFNVICFLDVPITFFTGELDPVTGQIIPKPFIKRWIIPGLLLQLLVNPAMKNVYSLVKNAAVTVFVELDVGRVMCWILAFVYPLWTWYFYGVVLGYHGPQRRPM